MPRTVAKGGGNRFKQHRGNAVDLLNVGGLVVLKRVNDLFINSVDYGRYRLLKNLGNKTMMWLMS